MQRHIRFGEDLPGIKAEKRALKGWIFKNSKRTNGVSDNERKGIYPQSEKEAKRADKSG